MSLSSVETNLNSHIDEKLKSISGLNAKEAPPISQKRLVAFVNHFVISTVEFLDTFSESCFVKLCECDRKINKIDTELKLLEAKLNSIPEVKDDDDIQMDLPPPEPASSSPQIDSQQLPELEGGEQVTPHNETEAEDASAQEPAAIAVDPRLARFQRMVQVGIHVEAVKIQMRVEGVDPDLLKV